MFLHMQFDCFTFSRDENIFCQDERAIVTFQETQRLFKYTWYSKGLFTLSVIMNAAMLRSDMMELLMLKLQIIHWCLV